MDNCAKFEVGQNVRIINSEKVGTINKIVEKDSGYGYKVMVDGKAITYAEKYLEPFIDEEESIISTIMEGEFGDSNDLSLFETWFRLKKPIEGNLYSYLGSRTIFNPYQFKPLMKFISSTSEERLFIADEVGVGKTIETGILLMELLARGRIDRNQPILIVCPNVLGPKWVNEMEKRFNFHFHLHDGKSLDNMFKIFNESKHMQNPWGIVSIQLLRSSKFMKFMQELAASKYEPIWSLVIIDEAHHMRNSGTESNTLGHLLSSLTNMMVMLSATPLNLRDEDLYNQMAILNPALFPDKQTFQAMISPVKSLNKIRRFLVNNTPDLGEEIMSELSQLSSDGIGQAILNHPGIQRLEDRLGKCQPLSSDEIAYYDRVISSLSPLDSSFTRTLKRESMEHKVLREILKVPVKLSPREYEFYVQTIQAIQESYLQKGGDPTALGFISNMPMRMLTSSIPAMKEYLEWSLKNDLVIEDNPFDEYDEDENVERPMSPELRELFRDLLNESEKLADEDTKFCEFEKLVASMMKSLDNKQIIVFSFFRRTLKYLKNRLSHIGYRTEIISGEVPLTSVNGITGRYEIMEKFEKGEIDILLSSEVGGEGLDFQFCQALINYDMPYNPMRVEQRIGRLDRFGQQADKVIIASLYLENTVDEKIYSLLYDRIHLIEDSVGYLEPIIGTQLADLQKGIIENTLSEQQIEKRMKEIEISVAQARYEQEKFENSRTELLGDDRLSQTIANMTMTDFVKPIDSLRLTKLFLSEKDGCRFSEIDADNCEMVLSNELVLQIEEYTRLPGSEGSLDELHPLLRSNKPVQAVFNGQKSLEKPKSVFLPPSGHWMKFILRNLEEQSRIRKILKVCGNSDDFNLPLGHYAVPLFEVTFEGFRTELNLAAVPVNLHDNIIPTLDYVKFMRTLGQLSYGKGNIEFLEDIEDKVEEARDSLEIQMEKKLDDLRVEHRYIAESRINSLKNGSEVRRVRITKQIDDHIKSSIRDGRQPSEEYLRLANGQIEKDLKRTEDRINRIRNKGDMTLSIALVGITLLEIKGDKFADN